MGLESATFISGLTASWPPSGDPKSQGDDHLRLIKSVLQNTFPNAAAPLYAPSSTAAAGPTTVGIVVADQNSTKFFDTAAGNVTLNLPTLTGANAGWAFDVIKYTADQNAVTVVPASGTIVTASGAVATVRVGAMGSLARFIWHGTAWFCSKMGAMVGSTIAFDGAAVPAGHLVLDGSAYNTTTFAELFAALGTGTLKDKRGRADIGAGTGAGLTNRVLGTNYGAETVALASGNLPPQTPAGSSNAGTFASTTATWAIMGILTGFQSGGSFNANIVTAQGQVTGATSATGFTGTPFAGQVSTPIGLLQASVATQKLIRAC